jgi:hypothetical protein
VPIGEEPTGPSLQAIPKMLEPIIYLHLHVVGEFRPRKRPDDLAISTRPRMREGPILSDRQRWNEGPPSRRPRRMSTIGTSFPTADDASSVVWDS